MACTYPDCDCPLAWAGDGPVPATVCPKALIDEEPVVCDGCGELKTECCCHMHGGENG